MHVRDVAAGALLLNTIPHLLIGLSGKRCMTPLGGPDSSAQLNLAWAGINLAGGIAALGPHRWRAADQVFADSRLRSVTLGMALMAGFGAVFELTPQAAQYRTIRAEAAAARR